MSLGDGLATTTSPLHECLCRLITSLAKPMFTARSLASARGVRGAAQDGVQDEAQLAVGEGCTSLLAALGLNGEDFGVDASLGDLVN